MAVYRKKLVDKDGNTIIPAIGDIYGPVYTASFKGASGGVATYTFTPDTPVEANRVYAVKFPAPSVNNAVILLGDGNMTASSILLPPVAASDNPSYEIAYAYNINDTEVWLLMYNGSGQWICLNQKNLVKSKDIGWTDMQKTDGGWDRCDFGVLHIIWKGQLFSNKANSWETIGTVPSDLVGGTLIDFQWTGQFGYSALCKSYSAQMSSAGVINATINSPSGNNFGYSVAIIAK